MVDDDVSELADLHPDIGADLGVTVAVVGDDVVGALRHHDHFPGEHTFGNRLAVADVELAARIDVERDLCRRDARITNPALQPDPARGQIEDFARGFRAKAHLFDCAGETQRHMHHVVSRRKLEYRRGRPILPKRRIRAGGIRLRGKNSPHETGGNGLRVAGKAGADGQIHLRGRRRRHRPQAVHAGSWRRPEPSTAPLMAPPRAQIAVVAPKIRLETGLAPQPA